MKNLEINIPFSGFYNSVYSGEVDAAVENIAESERERLENERPEFDYEVSEICAIVSDCVDYCAAHKVIAAAYVRAFNNWFSEETGVDLGLSFSEMTSPKEYNFTTDRIFAGISPAAVQELRAMVDVDLMDKTAVDRHKSRDGFISFYSYNWAADWPADCLEWDANQLCTLLTAVIAGIDQSADDAGDWSIFYEVQEKVYAAVDEAIDGAELSRRLAELVDEKQAAVDEEMENENPVDRFKVFPGTSTARIRQAAGYVDADKLAAVETLRKTENEADYIRAFCAVNNLTV